MASQSYKLLATTKKYRQNKFSTARSEAV